MAQTYGPPRGKATAKERKTANPVRWFRKARPQPLGAVLTSATRTAFRRRGFTDSTLPATWPEIVGPELARATRPVRLDPDGGVLTIRVSDGPAALLLQHRITSLLDRINTFCGRHAVSRIKLVQGPLPGAASTPGHESDPYGKTRNPAMGDHFS